MSILRRPIKLVECPRDAMQGLKSFIPTAQKIKYLNALLTVGFDTIDFGSFVSAPAVPQMKDTEEVLKSCDFDPNGTTKLLAVIANTRGAERALQFTDRLKYIGFPLSLSETFQQKNTNKSIASAFSQVQEIQNMCVGTNGKTEFIVFISMAFGNPYGEDCSVDAIMEFVSKLKAMGIQTISFADTVGYSTPDQITEIFTRAIREFPDLEFGAHFHSDPATGPQKVEAALKAGCTRFDSTIGGLGGCPFAKSTLVGNVSTETVLTVMQQCGVPFPKDFKKLKFINACSVKHEVLGLGLKEIMLTQVLSDEYRFIELCLEKFRAADVRNVGSLNESEFIAALKSAYEELGEPVPSAEKLHQSFDIADLTHDSKITFDEYMAGIRRGLKKRLHDMV
eukprot:PhF_6_TR30369/c0_g1_i1/m.44484/K01640/E4.1.3.4, HMGCL, hmgL; hydroxymethylglutaryl-CoA lyase